MTTLDNYLHYWKRSLVDATSIDLTDSKSTTLPIKDIQEGRLSPEQVSSLVRFAKMDKKETHIPLIVSWLVATPTLENGESTSKRKKPVSLLNIPVLVKIDDGELTPDEEKGHPYINRDYMSPTENPDIEPFAEMDKLDLALQKLNGTSYESWKDVQRWAVTIMSNVYGANPFLMGPLSSEFEQADIAYVIVNDGAGGAAGRIIDLYTSLIAEKDNEKSTNSLLRNLIAKPTLEKPPSHEEALFSLSHTGTMSDQFPVTWGQRLAIVSTITAQKGQVRVVNGPPGTGKTTLLQSVVASMWVNAALNEDRPPLIVASSMNNQAVSNIIDSFTNGLSDLEKSMGEDNVYWRPKAYRSLGTFACAKNRVEECEKKGYLYLSRGKSSLEHEKYTNFTGVFDQRLESEDLTQMVAYFLGRSGDKSLKDSAKRLKKQLEESYSDFKIKVSHYKSLLSTHDFSLDSPLSDVKKRLDELKWNKEQIALHGEGYQAVSSAVSKAYQSLSLFALLFNFIPAIKKRNLFTLQEAVRSCPNAPQSVGVLMQRHLTSISSIHGFISEINKLIELAKSEVKNHESLIYSLSARYDELGGQSNDNHSLGDIMSHQLDRGYRCRLFLLANHYWTARFLAECMENKDKKSADKSLKIWQRYAMLTPCFVSTLMSLPNYFGETLRWKESKGRAVIDLLIVDEAGQASPEVGAAAFSLAQKALVVGDTKQIEPVFGLSRPIDCGNMRQSGFDVSDSALAGFELQGMMASNGSVMKLALSATSQITTIHDKKLKGVILTEHFRCQPAIVDYCNDLAYDGVLEVKTPLDKSPLMPALSFLHCEGSSIRPSEGSRYNEAHARKAIEWIKEYTPAILQRFSKHNEPIEKLVAIVTPFKAMTTVTERLAKEAGLTVGKSENAMTIGTVHALQGAERPIILFLSVYGDNDNSMGFIDAGINMLNVAASRAKNHFIVIGNDDLYRKTPKRQPSGLLYQHIKQVESLKEIA